MPADRLGWIRRRAWLIGGGGLLGGPVGVVAWLGAVLITGDLHQSVSTVFALGAPCLGFATIGWAGSIMAGRGFENLQRHLRTHSRWSETDSRRAMSRIIGFGTGGMLGVTLISMVLM